MVQKESQHYDEPFGLRKKLVGKVPLALMILTAAGAGGSLVHLFSQAQPTSQSAPASNKGASSSVSSVAALGKLEPQGKITRLSAPAQAEGSRAGQVLAKEGDAVVAGQVVAILDSRDRRAAALTKAETEVKVATAQLAQVRSGKSGELAAQKAVVGKAEAEQGSINAQLETIARVEAQLKDARSQYDRFFKLYEDEAISAFELDGKRLSVATFEAQLKEAQATLVRLQQSVQAQVKEASANLNRTEATSPAEIQVAEAQIASAQATVLQAKEDLELSYIRSPIDATVLKVNVRPGEVIGNQGIADLGRTNEMTVLTQVYKTDVSKVRIGQRATITSEVFQGELQGTVSEVGLQVDQQNIIDTNPLAKTDNNIVEVRVRLDPQSSQKVAGLSNLQVQVVIAL